jgi:hypothetical protein
VNTNRALDFNALLQAANLVVAALLVYALSELEPNEYLDHTGILLGLTLCLQTAGVLLLEKRQRDPFVIMLAFVMIFYFAFRIFTLAVYPYSVVFVRYPYGPGDSSYSLVFILISNVFLYAGLLAVRFRNNLAVSAEGWRASRPSGVIVLLLAAVLFAYFRGGYWTEDTVPRALNFLVTFLTPDMTILMGVSYFLLFRHSLSRGFALTIGVVIVLDIVAHTLWGSRSAVVGFVQNCIVAALGVAGCIRVPRRFVLLGVLALPFAAVLLVAMFTISSYNRIANAASAETFGVSRTLALAGEASTELVSGPVVDLLLPPIAARAGFFDFSAEVIAHREEYQAIFSGASYGRSLIDNILTPGFDLYDQPKLSNALQFVYRDWGQPSKREASGDFYQSDQFGIYGELYALFAYASLPLMFLAAFLLKRLYVSISDPLPYMRAIKRVVVLFVFVKLINSFGLDWILGEVIPLIAGVYLYSFFFGSRRVVPPQAPLVPGAA